MFKLDGELKHLTQEQDQVGFEGERQSYRFDGVPFTMTRAFMSEFQEYQLLAWYAIVSINNMQGEKERMQRFIYKGKQFYAVSTWEDGTEPGDYVDPEELMVVFMMPGDY